MTRYEKTTPGMLLRQKASVPGRIDYRRRVGTSSIVKLAKSPMCLICCICCFCWCWCCCCCKRSENARMEAKGPTAVLDFNTTMDLKSKECESATLSTCCEKATPSKAERLQYLCESRNAIVNAQLHFHFSPKPWTLQRARGALLAPQL
ncbi:uncharacterized protein LY89DRAFT_109243 [Mollisia scopiformis]|uniref:Uncharacterized protein n=1 Tax=Mollisia scopiformis TaxID=149040 RepID=A0A194X590_MOLSC|nr:uncharacterized protein LY89DRAFT_109243 [Mollisia scopiformis]KUJ15341.1 hypothetical protein LY89DRAFT_109243 [Mollisia scopiformis]